MRRAAAVSLDTVLALLLCAGGAAAALFLAIAMAGCAGDDPRSAELRALYVGQDRELAAERPDVVAEKYATMAASRYAYLRGDAIVFYRDASLPAGEAAILRIDGTDETPLFADLHLENFGAVPDGAGTILDGTDFDSSVRGPFDWDLRRAALGLGALDSLRSGHDEHGDAATIARWVTAMVEGYRRGLTEAGTLARGELGATERALLVDADGRLAAREDLSRYTIADGTTRQIVRTAELIDVTSPWDQGLGDALALWAMSRRGGPLPPEQLVVKDIARRLQSGVASLSSHRFYVLLEGPAGVDDDLLLELKEARDPPLPLGLLGRGATVDGSVAGPLPADNAARVLLGASRLLSSPSAEVDFGRTSWNGVPFFVRSATRARRNNDTTQLAGDLDSGKLLDDDIVALATDEGRLLGRAHAHTQPNAALLIVAALSDSIRDRIVVRAVDDCRGLADDHDRFVALLARHGPLLDPPSLETP